MNRPPVTYPATLADLTMIADMAAELDAYKDCLTAKPAERARVVAMLNRAHARVETLARADVGLVYCEDEIHDEVAP